MFEHEKAQTDVMARLAICVVIAVAAVYAAEKLCQGKSWPLWEKYGPWILKNKLQAIAILAAILYGACLALWPEERSLPGEEPEQFEPCP